MLIAMPLRFVATVIFLARAALREIERELQHALAAMPRKHRLLQHELAFGAFEHHAAHRRILALGVLAHDPEVDVAGLASRERRGNTRKEPCGPQIHILVELAAKLQQRPPQRDVIGHGVGPADRAEQDRIGRLQLRFPVVRHHLAVLRVVVTARPFDVPIFEVDAEALRRDFEYAQRFGHYLDADAVAGDDGNPVFVRHAGLLLGEWVGDAVVAIFSWCIGSCGWSMRCTFDSARQGRTGAKV
ncbi:hypothetical protein OKW29_004248 [Paraburkholderia sp. CI3]